MATVAAGLVVTAGVMLAISSPARPPSLGSPVTAAVEYGAYLVLAAVGGLIARRRPDNKVGWLLLAATLLIGLQVVVFEYALLGVALADRLPGAHAAAALDTWIWMPGFLLLALALLHFPDGNLPGPRWRWLWLLVAVQICSIVVLAVASLKVDGVALLLEDGEANSFIDPYFLPSLSLLVMVVGTATASLLARFRTGKPEERQQLKWLMLPVAFFVAITAFETILYGAGVPTDGGVALLSEAVATLSTMAIPVAIGVAILRYRLYEIDRIISRTLTYATVVGLLAAVYAGTVFVLGWLLPVEGDLAVAGSTLAVAALFGPLRRRVQRWVDRRFNRSRYDADQEVSRFADRLRHKVEPGGITADLIRVVTRTVQPMSTGVWLRKPPS